MSDIFTELIGIFLIAQFISVCIVFVSVQTGFLFRRPTSFDQWYEVSTPVSVPNLYYYLSYRQSRCYIYMYNQNTFYCYGILMSYVGLQYSWNRVSVSLAFAYTPFSYSLSHTHWLFVLISHNFKSTCFTVSLTVLTISSIYLKYIFTLVFLMFLRIIYCFHIIISPVT